MQNIELFEYAILTALCAGSALAALWWMARKPAQQRLLEKALVSHNAKATFLFDGDQILDATPEGWKLLGDSAGDGDWSRLRQAVLARFPQFPVSNDDVRKSGYLTLTAVDAQDFAEVSAEWSNGLVRVDIQEANSTETKLQKVTGELSILQQAMDSAPYPSWLTDEEGNVSWFNSAYQRLCERFQREQPQIAKPLIDSTGDNWPANGKRRLALSLPGGGGQCWFDISMVECGTGRMFYAIDIDAVVNAEIAQRNFVQTLAKTFAQLSIGLAIFDRNRQLALFNPALIDLTQLPADFLSGRPNLLSFFDRLRDNRMMPEPKNYASWREQIADLVAAAADGRYLETWSLPSGQTYRVNGRPHPDGAVAFLFEDISAEVSLTRRFRSELELGQSLLDSLEDAIVVFASSGVLTLSNAAYRDMWGIDPDSTFVDMTVLDALRDWQSKCKPSPVWGEVRDFIADFEDRAEWDAIVETNTGNKYLCNVHPISGGATMIRFQNTEQTAKETEKKAEALTS